MSSSDFKEPLCFTDFALQEFAFGRLDGPTREQVSAHTETCTECATRLRQLQEETARLREVLALGENVAPPSATPCLERETLALYMDGALPDSEKQTCLNHLAGCARCRKTLVAVYRDLSQVLGEQQDASDAPEEPEKAGIILRMPKRRPRQKPPKTVESDGDSQDREAQL